MPYGATEELSGAVGASWEWSYIAEDNDGVPVDFTGCTGTAEFKAQMGGSVSLSATVAFSPGVIKCTATPSQTATLAPGTYFHEVEVTNSAGRKVRIVGGGDARTLVKGDV
jgi:hypothetical protein